MEIKTDGTTAGQMLTQVLEGKRRQLKALDDTIQNMQMMIVGHEDNSTRIRSEIRDLEKYLEKEYQDVVALLEAE